MNKIAQFLIGAMFITCANIICFNKISASLGDVCAVIFLVGGGIIISILLIEKSNP